MIIHSKELLLNAESAPVEQEFTQPILSANGTMGGSSFAVEASRVGNSQYAWYASDGNVRTFWGTGTGSGYPRTYTLYNPDPLKVSQIAVTNRNDRNVGFTGGDILASNDNANWVTLVSGWTNSVTTLGTTWYISVNSTNFYKYHQVYFTSGSFASSVAQGASEIKLTATYIIS